MTSGRRYGNVWSPPPLRFGSARQSAWHQAFLARLRPRMPAYSRALTEGMCSEVAQRARQPQPGCAEQPRPRHDSAPGRLPEARPLHDLHNGQVCAQAACGIATYMCYSIALPLHASLMQLHVCVGSHVYAPALRARAAHRVAPPQGSRQGSSPPAFIYAAY